MARRKQKERTNPPGWTITTTYQSPTGRWMSPGMEAHISGERGRFKFVEHVQTPTAEWVWFRDKDKKMRAFKPSRIGKVHVKARMR